MDSISLVSVVITTYQRDIKTLKRCIDSVHNQTYKNIEIILVDDNNNEDSYRKEIIEKISLTNLMHIKHAKNLGAQQSRNDGIKSVKGTFIAFLDDDDCWMPTKLEKQIKLFNEPNIGLVYSKGFTIYTESNKVISKKEYLYPQLFETEYTFKDLLFADYIGATSQVMVRKEVFDYCGYFDINQKARQDYEMWLRISMKYRCVGVDEHLFEYYLHEGEQISKNQINVVNGYLRIYNKYKKHYNLTARGHILSIIGFNYASLDSKKSRQYKFYSLLVYFFACIFDNREFFLRIRLKKNRILNAINGSE